MESALFLSVNAEIEEKFNKGKWSLKHERRIV